MTGFKVRVRRLANPAESPRFREPRATDTTGRVLYLQAEGLGFRV